LLREMKASGFKETKEKWKRHMGILPFALSHTRILTRRPHQTPHGHGGPVDQSQQQQQRWWYKLTAGDRHSL